MGYTGLLLNAPYKIDSMVWMRLMLFGSLFLVLYVFVSDMGLYEPGGVLGIETLK
jgi:hypothetical protein